MPLTIPNVGKLFLLDWKISPGPFYTYCSPVGLNPCWMRLYTNAPVISRTTVLGDFTESGAAGIAGGKIISPWSCSVINPANNLAEITSTLATFTNTSGAPVTVNGYFCTEGTSGTALLFCDSFAAPVVIGVGQTFAQQIIFQEGSLDGTN